jgi:hypothetical protein
MPAYHGTFFYGDYCAGFVRSFRVSDGRAVERRDWTRELNRDIQSISSFGVDAEGEIYIVAIEGTVYKVVPESP